MFQDIGWRELDASQYGSIEGLHVIVKWHKLCIIRLEKESVKVPDVMEAGKTYLIKSEFSV